MTFLDYVCASFLGLLLIDITGRIVRSVARFFKQPEAQRVVQRSISEEEYLKSPHYYTRLASKYGPIIIQDPGSVAQR